MRGRFALAFAALLLWQGAVDAGATPSISKAEVADALPTRMAEPPSQVFVRAPDDLANKTAVAKRLHYFVGKNWRWDVDLDAGLIRFSGAKAVATAPVQVIGTYNRKDGTWLWGWDHPSVPASVAVTAKAMQAYGARHDLPKLTTRKIACSEEEAWQFAAVASYLTGAEGAYRGPSGTTLIFMTYGKVTLSSPK